ncbi:MAG: hypothetical protein WCS73_12545 [Lentisphaeria bacterium]
MEKEEEKGLSVNIGQYDGKNPIEVIYRKGMAVKKPEPLETKKPEDISQHGVIETPLKWLQKRVDTIDQKSANIVVDREKMEITLTINERDSYLKSIFTGTVALSEIFEKLKINDAEDAWTPVKLGQFLRLNRCIFEDQEQCMILVSKLKNFMAKAKSEIQKMRDPSGSFAEVYRNEVESNLPKSFVICIPIFKGTEKQNIEIEFDHYLKDNEVYLQLVSPGANEIVEQYRDTVIDNVLERIAKIAPDIVIIEL